MDQHGKRADGSPYNRKNEGKTYAASIWEDLGGAMAVLCLVSTLAMADEMTCTAGDGKGNCTAATGPDGKVVVVVGEGAAIPGDPEKPAFIRHAHLSFRKPPCQNVTLV